MNTKIQELTQKIYQEGIEKGNAEAQQIIANARNQEAAILKEAQMKAEKILLDAQKQAADIKKNSESELKLFAGQAVSVLRTEIANMICGKIVQQSVSSALSEKEFMAKFLLTLAQEWVKNEELVIETADAKALTAFFASQAKGLLDKGVVIEQIDGKVGTFTIVPQKGAYKIAVGEEEFKAYFESFLRPQLVELLFA